MCSYLNDQQVALSELPVNVTDLICTKLVDASNVTVLSIIKNGLNTTVTVLTTLIVWRKQVSAGLIDHMNCSLLAATLCVDNKPSVRPSISVCKSTAV